MIPGYPMVLKLQYRSRAVHKLIVYHGPDKSNPGIKGYHFYFRPSNRMLHEIVHPRDLGEFTTALFPSPEILHTDCETMYDPDNIIILNWKEALPMNMRISSDMRMFKDTKGPIFRAETIDQIQRIIDRYKRLLVHTKGRVAC